MIQLIAKSRQLVCFVIDIGGFRQLGEPNFMPGSFFSRLEFIVSTFLSIWKHDLLCARNTLNGKTGLL